MAAPIASPFVVRSRVSAWGFIVALLIGIGFVAIGLKTLETALVPRRLGIFVEPPSWFFAALLIGFAGFMFLVGVSVGAESDLICFLVARYFKLSIYGTTLGLVHCVSFLASAAGGVAVSFTLARYDSFTPFLWVLAGTITLGSLMFLLLPKGRDVAKIG